MLNRKRTLAILMGFGLLFLAFSLDPPDGRTGAPMEGNCSDCHSPGNPNGFNGNISISGLPPTVTAGVTYPLTVTVTRTAGNPLRAGFQLVALDALNNNIGTLSNPGANTMITPTAVRTYMEHVPSLLFDGQNSVSWSASWTAPASAPGNEITFYANSILANANGNNQGDQMIHLEQTFMLDPVAVPLTADLTGIEGVSCFGEADGKARVIPQGGVGPYSYVWSNGANTQIVDNLPGGPASVTVTDGGGMMTITGGTIPQPNPLVANILSQQDIDCDTSEGTANAQGVGGTPPYSFAWSNGSAGPTAAFNAPDTYMLTVTDANGCTSTGSVVIGSDQTPPLAEAGPDVAINCNSTTQNLQGSGSEGPNINVNWSTSDGQIMSGANTYTPTVSAAGTYTLTVENTTNGCTATDEVMVTVDTIADFEVLFDITQMTNNQANDGSITAIPGENADTTSVRFSMESTTGDVGSTVCLPVTVTNFNEILGVQLSLNYDSTVLAYESLQIPGALQGLGTGQFGAPPETTNGIITLAWFDDDLSGETLDDGTVIFEVCFEILQNSPTTVEFTNEPAMIEISDLNSMVLDFVGQNAAINGGTPTDDYTYAWDTGATTATIDGLSPGTYCVTITDLDGCSSVGCAMINEFDCPDPGIALTVTDASCADGSDGAIDLDLLGTPPFTVNWSTGSTDTLLTGLSPDTYTVTVSDVDGCTYIETVTVGAPPAMEATFTVLSTPVCADAAEGSLSASVSGGVPPYTYAWDDPNMQTDSIATGLLPGTYTLMVTDASNCMYTEMIVLDGPSAFSVNVTTTHETSAGANDGTAEAMLTNGVAPFTYEWDSGVVDLSMLGDLMPDTYCVTVTDAMGCTATACGVVNSFNCADFVATAQITEPLCNGDLTGEINVTLGGTAPHEIQWSNDSTGLNLTGLAAGDYTITATDANNCMLIETYTINEPGLLVVAFVDTVAINCPGGNDGCVSALITGGTAPYTYAWSEGSTTNQICGLSAGTFDVSVTDANGCTAMASFTMADGVDTEAPEADLVNITVYLDADGMATITADSIDNGSEDNCGIESININQSSFDCDDLGENEVLVSILDFSNNSTNDTVMVTVADTLSPVLSCPQNVMVDCNNMITFDPPAATDNCAGVTITKIDGPDSGDVLDAGTYTLSYLATDAAGNEARCMMDVVVTEPLAVEETSVTADTLAGDVVLMAGAIDIEITGGTMPYDIEWSFGGAQVGTTEDLDGLESGVYTYTVTDNLGCSVTDTVEVDLFVIDAVVGHLPETTFRYFPNPAQKDLFVTLEAQTSHDWKLELYNAQGAVLREQRITNAQSVNTQFDVSDLPAGVYLLHVQQDDLIMYRKLVVE